MQKYQITEKKPSTVQLRLPQAVKLLATALSEYIITSYNNVLKPY